MKTFCETLARLATFLLGFSIINSSKQGGRAFVRGWWPPSFWEFGRKYMPILCPYEFCRLFWTWVWPPAPTPFQHCSKTARLVKWDIPKHGLFSCNCFNQSVGRIGHEIFLRIIFPIFSLNSPSLYIVPIFLAFLLHCIVPLFPTLSSSFVWFLVTGQRPFLPNMSPGQWIDLVEGKR